jgi:hypothetical protein
LHVLPCCSLAVLSEEGRRLRRVPLLEQGSACLGELALGEKVERESAAWQAFKQRRTLLWSKSR